MLDEIINSLAKVIEKDLKSCLDQEPKIFPLIHIGEEWYLLKFELSQNTNGKKQYNFKGYVNLRDSDEVKVFCGDYFEKLMDKRNVLKNEKEKSL